MCRYQGRVEDSTEHIIHMEDGSYKNISTKDVYNSSHSDYTAENIEDLISHQFSETSGTLFIKVKWITNEVF